MLSVSELQRLQADERSDALFQSREPKPRPLQRPSGVGGSSGTCQHSGSAAPARPSSLQALAFPLFAPPGRQRCSATSPLGVLPAARCIVPRAPASGRPIDRPSPIPSRNPRALLSDERAHGTTELSRFRGGPQASSRFPRGYTLPHHASQRRLDSRRAMRRSLGSFGSRDLPPIPGIRRPPAL